jgi:hypothetical protein
MSESSADHSTRITVNRTPAEAFAAILDPRAWWGKDIEGNTGVLGEDWTYRYKDIHYSKHQTVELAPGRKVVWHVVDGTLNFVRDKSEWTGTDLVFDIAEKDGRTEVRFTHRGLVPTVECFDICSDTWGGLITGSLRNLIETGVGNPDNFE